MTTGRWWFISYALDYEAGDGPKSRSAVSASTPGEFLAKLSAENRNSYFEHGRKFPLPTVHLVCWCELTEAQAIEIKPSLTREIGT